jgi:hypothetical protein
VPNGRRGEPAQNGVIDRIPPVSELLKENPTRPHYLLASIGIYCQLSSFLDAAWRLAAALLVQTDPDSMISTATLAHVGA